MSTTTDTLSSDKSKPRRIVASEWLIECFRQRREWPSEELFAQAKQSGFSRHEIWDAKTLLSFPPAHVETIANGDRQWVWRVPPSWPY
jgi:hypothetical protein